MRWDAQRVGYGAAGAPEPLPGIDRGIPGLLRTVSTPEFAGVRFHEVEARSALNAVPEGSPMPFRWTINPYRGCSHACTYCYARGSHGWLELDTGAGFDSEIVVKVNIERVLHAELARPAWQSEHVAMGTNTDPYQRAEGRYRLMPGIIAALAAAGSPMSILTKGTLLRRDLPLLAATARDVPVGLGVSVAVHEEALHRELEPGAPSPRARLDLVRAVRDAGLPCGVFLAPVLPGLTDSTEQLDAALAAIAQAGATGVTVVPLHLRPGARGWFLSRLASHRPDLLPLYAELYARGAYLPLEYRRRLVARVRPLRRRYGLDVSAATRPVADDDPGFPTGSLPAVVGGASGGPCGSVPAQGGGMRGPGGRQLRLL